MIKQNEIDWMKYCEWFIEGFQVIENNEKIEIHDIRFLMFE